MMIHMLVRQRRPLFRSHSSKERMRTFGAALWTARAKPLDQSGQPLAFLSEIAVVLHHQTLRRRRIPPHRFLVLQHLRLRDRPKDPSQKHPRLNPVPDRPLHHHRTVRHRLPRRPLPPLPLAGWPQPPDPLLNFLGRPRFKKVFHVEALRPPTRRQHPNPKIPAGLLFVVSPGFSFDWSV